MDLSFSIIFDLLFTRTYGGYAALVGVCLLVLLFKAPTPLLRRISGVLLWVCVFSLYDVYGYDYLVMTDSTARDTVRTLPELLPAYTAAVNAYRIVQWALQIVLTALVFSAAGSRAAFASMLMWWGGVCDLLYYALTMRSLPAQWDWMWFTPAGMLIDVLPLYLVLAQAAAVTLLGGLLIVIPPKDGRSGLSASIRRFGRKQRDH
jgi:hypothetical protein